MRIVLNCALAVPDSRRVTVIACTLARSASSTCVAAMQTSRRPGAPAPRVEAGVTTRREVNRFRLTERGERALAALDADLAQPLEAWRADVLHVQAPEQ